ncbi:hypothetical protein QE197_25575 (plasmid) [Arsenophonus nasoniae]|uniref:hypothetical protein n=1 Tax=Arsenophonus nasoniae TaxID=638 RepID=UPI0024698005|nr:hypothetical protein [Arsenophonus nasoniae]WGM13878.1 hypothetical protein QE197_25575 [Arsenophonus nasoniae]WGM18500.1 hypothetical protein QE193_25285 [Arsenophonus nasoniae]
MKNLDNNTIFLLFISMIFITFSLSSHLICFYLLNIGGFILIPSTVTYMLCFSILEYLSVTQNKKIVLSLIIIEFICIFIFSIISIIILEIPEKFVLINKEDYYYVLSPFKIMFISNLMGVTLSYLCIYFIFNSEFFKKYNFLMTAFITNLFLIVIYTPITNWFAFNKFNLDMFNLTITNIITNLFFISLYTMIFKYFVIKGKYNV